MAKSSYDGMAEIIKKTAYDVDKRRGYFSVSGGGEAKGKIKNALDAAEAADHVRFKADIDQIEYNTVNLLKTKPYGMTEKTNMAWALVMTAYIRADYGCGTVKNETLFTVADIMSELNLSADIYHRAEEWWLNNAMTVLFKKAKSGNISGIFDGVTADDLTSASRAFIYADFAYHSNIKPPKFAVTVTKVKVKLDIFVGSGLSRYIRIHNKIAAEKDLRVFCEVGAEDVYKNILELYDLRGNAQKKAADLLTDALYPECEEALVGYIKRSMK